MPAEEPDAGKPPVRFCEDFHAVKCGFYSTYFYSSPPFSKAAKASDGENFAILPGS
jgi:hypothetical protein